MKKFRILLLDRSPHWASYAAPCDVPRRGLRVRSKRRGPNTVGVVERTDGRDTFYPILVRWPDGSREWCREGELRGLHRWGWGWR